MVHGDLTWRLIAGLCARAAALALAAARAVAPSAALGHDVLGEAEDGGLPSSREGPDVGVVEDDGFLRRLFFRCRLLDLNRGVGQEQLLLWGEGWALHFRGGVGLGGDWNGFPGLLGQKPFRLCDSGFGLWQCDDGGVLFGGLFDGYGGGQLLLLALFLCRFNLAEALDIQLPAGELGGEADVLALASDGEGELAIGDDGAGSLVDLVEVHLEDLGRAEGVGDEVLGFVFPLDDVYVLALKLVDDVLNAETTEADAGADGVDPLLARGNGHLAAGAGFAGNGLDFDDAVEDFGDFALEETADEVAVSAGEDDLWTAGGLRDLHFIELHGEVGAIALGGDLLFPGHEGFGATDADDGVLGFNALDAAGDELADAVGELGDDELALGLAEALEDDLLGGLRGDAANGWDVGLELEDVSDLSGGPDLPCVFEGDLLLRVLDVFDDGLLFEDLDFTVVGVQADGDVVAGGEAVFPIGRGEGGFYGGHDALLGQPALRRQLGDGQEEIALHFPRPP